jgi:hypothetical protein
MFKKIEDAEKLCDAPKKFKDREEYQKYRDNVELAIGSYKDMCFSNRYGPHMRAAALISFIRRIPDEGLDMLNRLCDSLRFLDAKEQIQTASILMQAAKTPDVPSKNRLATAVTLYNGGYLEMCYTCLCDLAFDSTMMIEDRIIACRYLFTSFDDKHKAAAQECLLDVISTTAYPCSFRYQVIAAYIHQNGLSLEMNSSKLKIPYDEKFVYGLQTAFFFNAQNNVRERILSGQHLLGMECATDEEKREVGDILITVARNEDYDENVRADAADVLLRLGVGEQKQSARDIIVKLGFNPGLSARQSPLDKIRTIYSNSQNIHDNTISESVSKFIEKINKNFKVQRKSYNQVHHEVSELIRSHKLKPVQRISAFKALNRVSVDSATFTFKKTTLAEIFIYLWDVISSHTGDTKKLLEDLLVGELIDMGDTCSSGHAGRFVNVLTVVDPSIKISYESQIVANISGRMQAELRNQPQSVQDGVVMGITDDANDEDIAVLKKFLAIAEPKLRSEMAEEFVRGGYTKEKEFSDAFEKGMMQWRPKK